MSKLLLDLMFNDGHIEYWMNLRQSDDLSRTRVCEHDLNFRGQAL